MSGLRSHRRVVAGVLAVAVAAVTGSMLLLRPSGATVLGVLGLSVAVAGLLVTVVEAWAKSRSKERLLDVARKLARVVRDQEAGVLARLMANSGDPAPAEVSFAQPALKYWRTDGGDRQGMLSEVKEYFQSLTRGRLIVLGESGAGKTVLAIQLVLDLAAASRIAVADSTGRLPRVPVRLSLPTFDPGDDVDVVLPEVVSDRLDGWLTRHLETAFGLPGKVAHTLVTEGWILPVLDGLDEMDLDDVVPRRAASVIRAVNHVAGGEVRPVVITCRTGRYRQLSGLVEPTRQGLPAAKDATSNVGRREVVQDATVVGVQPLTALSAVDYLTYLFPEPADRRRVESRWGPIVQRLTAINNGHDPLAAVLGSPLRLFLTVTAYQDPDSTPNELTALATAAQLDEHLFARLVPAVLEQHPPTGRQYTASEVTRWLTTLAHHLADQGERGGSSSDLRLDRLWPAAGWRAPRYAATAVSTTIAGVLLAFGALAQWPPAMLPVLGLAVFVVLVAWIAARPTVDLRRLDLNGLRTSAGRRRIGQLLAFGLTAGLAGGLMLATVSTPGFAGVLKCGALGLVGAFVVGLGSGPTTRPTAIDRPARLVQQGIVHTIAAFVAAPLTIVLTDKLISGGLAAGLLGALVAGLAIGLAVGIAIGPVSGLAAGIALALKSSNYLGGLPYAVAALVVGLIFVADSPWPRYLFATVLLARRGDLPRRPAVFIDWAYQAGLMRLSGIAVQFRHREFQTWLLTRDQ
jgi:hypothetical protein